MPKRRPDSYFDDLFDTKAASQNGRSVSDNSKSAGRSASKKEKSNSKPSREERKTVMREEHAQRRAKTEEAGEPIKPRRGKYLPALIPPMHEDIAKELTKIPFIPQKITHESSPEDELNSNAELLHAAACQLQDKLRHTDLCINSVAKLVNGTVRFLKARRELLNFENTHDPNGAIPIKPPVRPIG